MTTAYQKIFALCGIILIITAFIFAGYNDSKYLRDAKNQFCSLYEQNI